MTGWEYGLPGVPPDDVQGVVQHTTSPQLDAFPNGSIDPVTDTRMDKIPARALLAVGRALKHGMKYEVGRPDNWRGVPAEVHLNHAMRHIALHTTGDTSDDHIGHALTRVLMWGELSL